MNFTEQEKDMLKLALTSLREEYVELSQIPSDLVWSLACQEKVNMIDGMIANITQRISI